LLVLAALSQSTAVENSSAWQKVGDTASEEAEAAIEAMHVLADRFEAMSHNKSHVQTVVDAIVAKAFEEHKAQHLTGLRDFEHKLSDVNATLLAKKNASDVKSAFEAAERAETELRHVEKATVHAIKEGIHRMTKKGKAQARGALREAKEAARKAKRSGKMMAKAQRAEGDAEREYESTESTIERSAERLEERAELAGERAEREVEKAVGAVEEEAEDRADIINRDSEIAREARKHRLDLAEQAVARAVAHERKEERSRAAAAAAVQARAQQKAAAETKARNSSAGTQAAGVQSANPSAGTKAARVQNDSEGAGHRAGAEKAGTGSSAEGGVEAETKTAHQGADLGSQRFLAGLASGRTTTNMGMLTACAAMMTAVVAVSAAAISWRASRSSVRIGESPLLG